VTIAALLAVFVAYQYWKKAVLNRRWQWLRKETSPSTFWIIIIGQAVMAVVIAVHESHILQP